VLPTVTAGACKSCSIFPYAATCDSNGALTCTISGASPVNGICFASDGPHALYLGYQFFRSGTSWDELKYCMLFSCLSGDYLTDG
jgi:hypothetical protein